jgi:hypothetical protein
VGAGQSPGGPHELSDTLVNVRNRVRDRIKDTDHSNFEIPSFDLDRDIEDAMRVVAASVPQGKSIVTGLVTLVANTYDYALPSTGSLQYKNISYLWLVSLGTMIQKVTPETLEASLFLASGGVSKGPPNRFCLIESTTQGITVRFSPSPVTADTVDALVSYVPQALASDSDVLPFSRDGLTAIEMLAACSAARGMDPEARARRLLNAEKLDRWDGFAARLINEEACRMQRLQRTGQVERVSR